MRASTKVEKYRKKPVVIEAIQFDGNNHDAIGRFAGFHARATDQKDTLLVITEEGPLTAPLGWWIIRGIKGEFYPCRPDIFQATYEPLAKDAQK